MKHVEGNQRPVATMSRRANAPLLPSARIHCDSGRIRVGDRTFVSASDALSVYLQQFDGKQQRQKSPGGSPRRSTPANTSVDASLCKSVHARSTSPVVRGRSSDLANVTGLLTSSPNPVDVLGGRSMTNGRMSPAHSQLSSSFSTGYSSSRLLNGEEPSSKHSVSFSAMPDSADISQYNSRHSLSFDSNTGRSANSPRHNPANGNHHRVGLTNGHAGISMQHTAPLHSAGLHHLTSSNSALPQHALATSNGVSHANRLLPRSSQPVKENELLPKTNGVVHTNGYLDIADIRKDALPPSSAVGGKRPKSEVEVLLTAMPSQQELEMMAQDTLREVKLKRMLKEANSLQPSSLSPSSTDSQQLSPVSGSSLRNSFLPSKLQDSSFSKLHDFSVSKLQDFSVSKLPDSSVSNLRDHSVSNLKDSCVSSLKDTSDSRLPQTSTDSTLPQSSGKTLQRSSSNSSNKSSLQQEVEDALSRSAQLLETIKTDTLVSPRCISDVGSLNTEVLLSVDPYRPEEAASAIAEASREGRSRHRYSYHTPGHLPRSRSMGRASFATEQRSLRDTGRRRSVESLPDSFAEDKVFQDLNQSVSLLSDSEDILKRLQSPKGPSTSEQMGNSIQRSARHSGPPSWIQELMVNTPTKRTNGKGSGHLEESIFSERGISGGRQAPSWVDGLEHSEIASSLDAQDLSYPAGATRTQPGVTAPDRAEESSVTDLSYAGPGLNYSDLIASPGKLKVSFSDDLEVKAGRKRPGKISRNNSFSGVSSIRNGHRKDADRSKPPVTISRFHQDLAGVDVSGPQHNQASAANLSSPLAADNFTSILRKKVCEDAVDAKQSMDKYLAGLDGELTKNGRAGQDGLGRIPRCSSVDSVNAISQRGSVPSDLTWASPITRDSNLSSKWCQDDPTLTPARHTRDLRPAAGLTSARADGGLTVDTDPDLLEGDRPWEAMLPSYKSPVQVGSISPGKTQAVRSRPGTPTLSGGQQPGSMEALKQMLFRLQTEETSFTAPSASDIGHQENGEKTELIPALKDYDFEVEPGGQSLERALVHLGRLKTLVQTGTSGPQSSSSQQQDQAN